NYDVVHVTTRHATMSDQELLAIYNKAWDLYYSPEHVESVLRRARLWGYHPRNMMMKMFTYHAMARIEHVHPLESGLFRRKYRKDRRPGMPLESRFGFYLGCAWEIISKHIRAVGLYWQYRGILRRVMRDSTLHRDIAMEAVEESELERLELYNATQSSRLAVEKVRRRKRALAGSRL